MEDLDTPQIITHIENNINHSIFDCKWIPCSAKFVVIGGLPKGSGTIEIFEITSGEARKIKDIERPNSFKCGTFGASSDVERRLATGDFKGTLELWDLEKSCQVYITKEHTDIINSIDGMGGNTMNCGAPEIVTGSRDGTVKVWDPRQRGKPVANMQPAKGETRRDCWTVAFGNSFNDAERIIVAGYDNGDMKMFDLRTMSLRWECNLKNGVRIFGLFLLLILCYRKTKNQGRGSIIGQCIRRVSEGCGFDPSLMPGPRGFFSNYIFFRFKHQTVTCLTNSLKFFNSYIKFNSIQFGLRS
ncbi:unnamed protein product [Chilo suppressalis]|uniref:WD repeat-containing protein 92 n=1 Tax=Chilo suppressalis TaxID=168631 RepID=A0ABN8L2N2_CHISP|nr:unnamed protein product [Chilo suppressalis]